MILWPNLFLRGVQKGDRVHSTALHRGNNGIGCMQGIRVIPQNTHMTAAHRTRKCTRAHTLTKTYLLHHFVAITREFLLQLALEVANIHDIVEELHGLDLGHVLEEHIQTRPFVPLQEVDLPRVHSIVGPAHACISTNTIISHLPTPHHSAGSVSDGCETANRACHCQSHNGKNLFEQGIRVFWHCVV